MILKKRSLILQEFSSITNFIIYVPEHSENKRKSGLSIWGYGRISPVVESRITRVPHIFASA